MEINPFGVTDPIWGLQMGLLWDAIFSLKLLKNAIFHGIFGGKMPQKWSKTGDTQKSLFICLKMSSSLQIKPYGVIGPFCGGPNGMPFYLKWLKYAISMGCLVEKSQNMLILTLALLENTSGLEIDLCGVYPVFGAHNGLLWVAVSTLKWLRYAIFHGMFGGEMPLKIPKCVHIDTCLIRKYLLGEI